MFYHLLHYDFSQMTWKIVTEHKNGKSFTTTSWNPKEITEIQKKIWKEKKFKWKYGPGSMKITLVKLNCKQASNFK